LEQGAPYLVALLVLPKAVVYLGMKLLILLKALDVFLLAFHDGFSELYNLNLTLREFALAGI